MEKVNQKYRIKATVVSPLNIGQGGEKDWVEGVDFIRHNKVLYHLNLDLIEEAGVPINEISALFASMQIDKIKNLLLPIIDDIYDFSMEMRIGSTNPVKTFSTNPISGNYILYGSSLKGAIRSSLFHYLTKDEHKDDLKNKKNRLDEYVFGRINDGTNFMRFIRVGDFDFDYDKTALYNTKIYNLRSSDGHEWEGGWKNGANNTTPVFDHKGFNTIYECLIPRSHAFGSICISPLLYSRVKGHMDFKSSKDKISDTDFINQLFDLINASTSEYIDKELSFFEMYSQGENADKIIQSLKRYSSIISSFPKSGATKCLIKMAAGTGFHSITGDWQYDDYTNTGMRDMRKRYKSRKIACYNDVFTPMGFLQLELSE